MLTAVQELASAPEGKYIGSLSWTVCSFLIACYKDEGNFWMVHIPLSEQYFSGFSYFLTLYLHCRLLTDYCIFCRK